jgi:thioredoxin 1
MSRLPAVDDATFAERVERAPGLTLVDFGAAWCGPCRVIAPVVERLAAEYAPRLSVLSMDVDDNPVTAARFGIRGMPTLLFFRDGAVVDRVVGAVPRAVLQARLEALLAPARL